MTGAIYIRWMFYQNDQKVHTTMFVNGFSQETDFYHELHEFKTFLLTSKAKLPL